MELSYDIFGNVEPSDIYLAKPGQRIIHGLYGIREDTCYLEKNFNNTSVLEFTIDRDIDGEINPIYELVQQHYEIYIPHHGWFKINEEPLIESDGNVETKQVRAESLEIELQQYDIMDFEINTASVSSKEMMATDNAYEKDDYLMWHDRVVFYRDTSKLQQFSNNFENYNIQDSSDLERYLYDYPELLNSWRIDFDYSTIDQAIQDTVDEYRSHGQASMANSLATYIGKFHPSPDAYGSMKESVMYLWTNKNYHFLRKHIHIIVQQRYDPDDPSSAWYSLREVIDLEIQREKELSLLTILLEEHGWNIGYIDATPRLASDNKYYKLAEETGQFQVDSQDIYSFITQDLASYFQCIFVFNTETYTVNAYRIENIGLDTNIYLSFHNIQNSVNRNSDKQIYTVFNVLGGDDLHIDEANFGESWIEDISYFLNTNHFTDEFIDKYYNWEDYRDYNTVEGKTRRQIYMELSIQRRKADEVATEIYSRVPVDGMDPYQYATMSDDELVEEFNKYVAILEGYRSTYINKDGEYIGDEAFEEQYPRDFSDYKMIRDELIGTPEDPGNIRIAMENRQVSSASDTREYLDNWKFDFDTYGLSYGVHELETQITTIKNQMDTMEKRGQNVPGEQGDQYAQNNYELYQKYAAALQSAQVAYQERLQEYNEAYDIYLDWNDQLQTLKQDCVITNPQFGFTDDELWLLDKYRIHTDYTNENIITTSLSNAADWVNTAYQLYLDAKEQLSAEAQPQWTFSTTQDNLLLMPEFKDWHMQLELGSFIRVAMRDDYQVKLRVITIGFNPFLIEPTIDLQFSNMVQYASKRDDFVSLLQNGRGSSKNQISSAMTSTNSNADINIDSGFLLKLINNGVFNSYMTNFSSDITGQVLGSATSAAISAVSGNIGTLVSEQINAVEINVDRITGKQAWFEEVAADYIDAGYIAAKMINASKADIDELSSKIVTVAGQNGDFTQIIGGYITTNGINAKNITGETGDFEELTAGIINSEQIKALTIDVDNITGDLANFASLVAEHIEVGDISADTLKARLAEITFLDADNIIAENTFTQFLQSVSSQTINSSVTKEFVVNLIAKQVTAADILTGDITISDNMRILSENGGLVMNGTALQIYGKDEEGNDYVGIQLGYDTSDTPSLILRNGAGIGNESGTIMITPAGITQDAIADELIINDMIKEGTIDADRLNFSVMKEGDSVSITQIKDGSGGEWGVQYTTFTNKVINTFMDMSSEFNDSSVYTMYIETPSGVNIRGGNVDLYVHLYRNNYDVTGDFPDSCFVWTRHSADQDGDLEWNNSNITGKELHVTGEDINISATFECNFNYNYDFTQQPYNEDALYPEGTQVDFVCDAPNTQSYNWYQRPDGADYFQFIGDGNTLSFVLSEESEGSYYCQATDGITTIRSYTTMVHIGEPSL